MDHIEGYRSLKGLPALAGIADFPSAAGPGLSVDAAVLRLKRLHYASQRLWQTCLARLTSEPLYELKMGFSYHAYLAAEHITLLRERVAEMRHPPLGLDKIPDPALESFFDEILAAPTSRLLLGGLYQVALPALFSAVEAMQRDCNPLAEAPTLRVLRTLHTDLLEMIAWGKESLAVLPAEPEEMPWLHELAAWLDAAGSLDGTGAPSSAPHPRYAANGFRYDRTPQRDERFPDPYNMGVHAEEFLYDPAFPVRDKVLMMLFKRLREIDVPEMMASLLYEMVTATGDEEAGGKKWAFYRDMTRQLWDEARHAMMGEVGFARLGIDWPNFVCVNFTWSKGLNEQLTPRERHAVLWFIEQGLMSKTGKRFEWELGRDSGDAYAELIQDYDWADEVLHARIGRDWYVAGFPDVKTAAEYGSACWDKVVADWEQWRNDGLTRHFNWWPGLYREACRLRGEEPDPEIERYSVSYAETRADLRRIAASG
ncbi:hypothetical protein [Luteolibacter luteus]|uniref:Uncharacterized protein n=1 Tax=Luteolibacter luteus TaxID=2728835 RepID=A0A858RDP6_9BACT|nr:hypothetical protein [Luteolibacter luteus]QJE94835.1 hypothetical protein HHL09_03260 [Luteolibacter luteus]